QIVIKVFGEDPDVLRQRAADVLHAIADVRGIDRAFIDRAGEMPQLQITIDRDRAARYGLNVADIEDAIETAIGGKVATEMWEGDKRFGVAVRLRDEERRNPASIGNLPIDTASGARVPLEDVARLGERGGAMNIARESGMRLAAVGVFIKGRDMGSVVRDMKARVAGRVTFPPGYFVTWGGEFENQQRATALLAMLGLLPMALSHDIGSEVQRPLAVVVIGGLVSATLLTLVVLPVLYFVLERGRARA